MVRIGASTILPDGCTLWASHLHQLAGVGRLRRLGLLLRVTCLIWRRRDICGKPDLCQVLGGCDSGCDGWNNQGLARRPVLSLRAKRQRKNYKAAETRLRSASSTRRIVEVPMEMHQDTTSENDTPVQPQCEFCVLGKGNAVEIAARETM